MTLNGKNISQSGTFDVVDDKNATGFVSVSRKMQHMKRILDSICLLWRELGEPDKSSIF